MKLKCSGKLVDTVNTDLGLKKFPVTTWIQNGGGGEGKSCELIDNEELNKRKNKMWEHSVMNTSLSRQRSRLYTSFTKRRV